MAVPQLSDADAVLTSRSVALLAIITILEIARIRPPFGLRATVTGFSAYLDCSSEACKQVVLATEPSFLKMVLFAGELVRKFRECLLDGLVDSFPHLRRVAELIAAGGSPDCLVRSLIEYANHE